jgi:hypothetical protein
MGLTVEGEKTFLLVKMQLTASKAERLIVTTLSARFTKESPVESLQFIEVTSQPEVADSPRK